MKRSVRNAVVFLVLSRGLLAWSPVHAFPAEERADAERGSRRGRRRVPTREQLSTRIDKLSGIRGVDRGLVGRLKGGLEHADKVDVRRRMFRAIEQEEREVKLRGRFDILGRDSYKAGERGQLRPKRTADIPTDPKTPDFVGIFNQPHWKQLRSEQRFNALGLVSGDGTVSRPLATEYTPTPEDMDSIGRRKRVWRKAPRYLGGMLSPIFGNDKAAKLQGKLDQVLTPTEQGSYELHADKVTLLYPDTPITPSDKPRFKQVRADTIKAEDTAFVFVQSYEFTDQKAMKDIADVAKKGVPVYAVVGEVDADHPVHKIWGKGSKVHWVASHKEEQGSGREFRIDHNKNTFVVKKDGSVIVFKGGINYNKLSSQNVDLGHMLEGGNVGLDVLDPMMRDYLRGGGKFEVKDLQKISGAIENMIEAKPKRGSIKVETAVTSSHLAGKGKAMSSADLDRELKKPGELFLSGESLLKALTPAGSRGHEKVAATRNALLEAAARGKRIVVSRHRDPEKGRAFEREVRKEVKKAVADAKKEMKDADPEKLQRIADATERRMRAVQPMSKEDRALLRELTEGWDELGVEFVTPATLYIDNSTENVMHRLVKEAAERGETIWQGAFANSDGNFTKRLIEASRKLEDVNPNAQVEVLSADLRIATDEDDPHGRQINNGSDARMMLNTKFNGEVTGIGEIPGPKDERGGRKFHMKVLASYREGKGKREASGQYTLKSNNDSKHGFEVNEESSMTVYSPELAKEVIDFLDVAKKEYGTKLKPPFELADVDITERDTLTEKVVTPETTLRDMMFIVMDYETDGLSMHTDARITEKAATAYTLDDKGKKLTEVDIEGMPSQFNRLLNTGVDHYGNRKLIPKDIVELTHITNDMVEFAPSPEAVMNDFNNWVRTLEKKSGKTVMFVGQNFASFDRRAYNDHNGRKGIEGNPYMDGDVADTLRAIEKIHPGTEHKRLSEAILEEGIKPPPGRAHRANYDIKMNAMLFERQLQKLADGLTVEDRDGNAIELTPKLGDLADVRWGDIRHVFLSKAQLEEEAKAAAGGE